MNRTILIVIIAAITGVVVVGALVWNDSAPAPQVDPPTLGTDGSDNVADSGRGDGSAEADPARNADARMNELKRPQERVEHLAWISKQDWAKSDLPVLRKTIVNDPDESVQIRAVEAALELAATEGDSATSNVIRTSLASANGNTRARGLKAARISAAPELVPDLIQLVDNRDEYAAMALNALAYTDSRRAQAKVLEVAEDETATPAIRQRAVTLLAVTKNDEAYGLLTNLANGNDETLADLASKVLRELNR